MTTEEFARICKLFGSDSAVRITLDNLSQPPGRSPSPRLIALSPWFKALAVEDKSMVEAVVRYAAETAVFEVLAILDGVKVVDNAHNTFELRQKQNDTETILNDPEQDYLHDLFQELCNGGWAV